MANRRVRIGQVFIFNPTLLDKIHPPFDVKFGDEVKVIHLTGCPPTNTMGHCYVAHVATGKSAGLVATNSLDTKQEFVVYLKNRVAAHADNPVNKNVVVTRDRRCCIFHFSGGDTALSCGGDIVVGETRYTGKTKREAVTEIENAFAAIQKRGQ